MTQQQPNKTNFESNMASAFGLSANSAAQLPTTNKQLPQTMSDKDSDIELARDTVIDTIDTAQKSLVELARIASVSESPRAYEVLEKLARTISDMSKDLIKVHEMKRDLNTSSDQKETINSSGQTTVIMTTEKMLERAKEAFKSGKEE